MSSKVLKGSADNDSELGSFGCVCRGLRIEAGSRALRCSLFDIVDDSSYFRLSALLLPGGCCRRAISVGSMLSLSLLILFLPLAQRWTCYYLYKERTAPITALPSVAGELVLAARCKLDPLC